MENPFLINDVLVLEFPTVIGKSQVGRLSLCLSVCVCVYCTVQDPANCCGRVIHNLEMQGLNQETKDWRDCLFISVVFVLLDWHNCSLEIVMASLRVFS